MDKISNDLEFELALKRIQKMREHYDRLKRTAAELDEVIADCRKEIHCD